MSPCNHLMEQLYPTQKLLAVTILVSMISEWYIYSLCWCDIILYIIPAGQPLPSASMVRGVPWHSHHIHHSGQGSGIAHKGYLDLQHFDGLVQERCNSSVLAMELGVSCTNPSIWLFNLDYDPENRLLQSIKNTCVTSQCRASKINLSLLTQQFVFKRFMKGCWQDRPPSIE